jgi:hypothetical protein
MLIQLPMPCRVIARRVDNGLVEKGVVLGHLLVSGVSFAADRYGCLAGCSAWYGLYYFCASKRAIEKKLDIYAEPFDIPLQSRKNSPGVAPNWRRKAAIKADSES